MNESNHILLVEDDPDQAELIRTVLRRGDAPLTLTHLPDGQAALEHLATLEQTPASQWPRCILLDLRLPRVDGLEVLKAIKDHERLRSIPVVILTTSAREEDLAHAYANHVNSYLVKPVQFGELRQLLAALGEYWIGLNRQP